MRVSRASDDAGRIGSITLAESSVRGLRKSIQNLNDGLSLAQTLEGGLAQMDLILQRIRELAVQASNDTYSANDRLAMQQETIQLLDQVDAIAEQTQFNQINLLNGDATALGVFVDDGIRESSFELQLHDIRDSSVGRKAQYDSQRRGVHVSDLQNGDLTINGFKVRGTTDSDDTLSFSFGSGSAIAKARAINAISELTGVTARAGINQVVANRQIGPFTLTETQYFSVNGVKVGGFAIVDFDSDGALRQAINDHHEETGVIASLTANGELQLIAADGRNIQIHYSHKNVLEAVGLGDTTLDPNNLAGDVILGEPDRDLKGTIQNLSTTGGFVAGLNEVGGRFDGSEAPKDNYVDFVGHVVKAGGVGVAEIVWERDPAGDPGPAEDFAFIEGGVNAAPDVSGVNGSFFATGGTIIAGGSYNEGLNRDYLLTVTQGGSTDGPDLAKRAVVRVSTAEDGILINALTLDAAAGNQLIATATTGEDVFIDIGQSFRSEDISESGAQEYDGALGAGVTVGGAYTGDVSKDFTVRVIESGYTQGVNLAKVEVVEHNLVTGATTTLGSFQVNAGAPIVVGDGLTIEFAAESPTFGTFSTGTVGSYAGAISVDSAPADFVGERGDGQYGIRITQAGPTGLAQYVTTFDGADITVAQTLEAGSNVLADGLSFDFDASVSTIGNTSIVTQNGDYGDYNGVTIGGNYDGQLNDIDVQVRVKSEGRVIADGEGEQDDAAILEYSLDGGANFQGDIVAVAGQDLALDNGLTVRLDNASAISELTDLGGNVLGASHTFASGTVRGYDGQITFELDQTQLELSADAEISVQAINAKVGTGVAGDGRIRIRVLSGGVETVTELEDVQSGATHTVINGLDVTFTNDAPSIEDQTAGNNDGADITLEAGATYNGALGDGTLEVVYTGDTNRSASANNGDRVGVSLAGVYNGSVDDETYTLTFDGADQQIARTDGGVNDGAGSEITIIDPYNGSNQDKSLTITYVGGAVETSTNNGGAVDPSAFNVAVNGNYNRTAQNKTLIVNFEAKTAATFIDHIPNGATFSGAVASLSSTSYDWDAGSHLIEVVFVADNTAVLHIDGDAVGPLLTGATLATIDLGSADYLPEFNNVDPGIDINVVVDPGVDETNERLRFQFDAIQSVAILDVDGGGVPIQDVILTDPVTSLDLSDAKFAPIFGGVDPGVTLDITQADVAQADVFQVDLTAIREVTVSDGTTTVNNVDISGGVIDLGDAQFAGIFTGGDPGVTLGIADTFAGVDDEYTLNLTTKTTVTVRDSGNNVIEANADVSGGNYTIAGTGVTVNFADANVAVDDVVTVDVGMDKTVEVFFEGAQEGGKFDVSGGSLDLGAVFGGSDPGFDLDVANPVKGRDDTFTFELTRDRGLQNGNESVLEIEQRTLAANDLFTADVDAGTLEVGSAYTLEVDAPALEVGKEYLIEERVGTLEAGDQIVVQAFHDFAQGPTVLQTTTALSNGLTLEIDPGANFNIGDEVRFQALQYQGDPISSGPYDDPAFPTTFEVEVIQSGAVDGAAQVRYTRLDNGDTGVVNAQSNATLLQNNVHVAFSAGTLYAGDKFFIETVSDLAQDFGAELILESDEGIEIQLSSVTIDNELGRLMYVGDPALANLAGTFGSVTSGFLGINAEQTISELDLTHKQGAQEALRILDLAIDQVASFRSETGATQNRIQRQLESLSMAQYQTENYVSRIRDADIAFEVAELAQSQILQNAGVQMLAQINFNPDIALRLLDALS